MANGLQRLVAAAALSLAGSAALAAPNMDSGPEQVSASDLLAELQRLQSMGALMTEPTANPSNFGVTGGFGLPRGAFAVSASYTDAEPQGKDDFVSGDGSLGAAIGLGDPYEAVGLDLSLGIISVGDDFGQDGTVGVRLHRILPGFVPGGVSSVSAGVSNASRWGDAEDLDRNYYGAFSTTLPTPSGVSSMITVGYGSNVDKNSTDGAIYGSLGIGWNAYVNTTAAWSGEEMILSAGFKPFLDRNVIITAGAGDVTDEIDNRRFLLTVAWFTQDLF